MTRKKLILSLIAFLCCYGFTQAASGYYELNEGWKYKAIAKVKDNGEKISLTTYNISKWDPATVPGTVLTTLVNNKKFPDPFYGMNNEHIPDISKVGRDYYTYWFVKDFKETAPKEGNQVWLSFRGINYSCKIFVNGHLVNKDPYKGMFMRKSFNITKLITQNGKNRLAVIVFPPDEVGVPNGGQGGDGKIAKNLCIQYTPGWDWIQPIRDRNTGIWDKVCIEHTGCVKVNNPHIVTLVPGKRLPDAKKQDDAVLKVSAELQNATNASVTGIACFKFNNKEVKKQVTLKANSTTEVTFDDFTVQNPKLWWPSGYGDQYLYDLTVGFTPNHQQKMSDSQNLKVGIRQIQSKWNEHTQSRQILVNGQKIFIKGGDWVISDAMLNFSKERYDAEIRYHRDMNLNLIRIWGGALTERPEFYDACDKYGLLVFQDFWFSGDCDGRWLDPYKADDQWTRRKYPDDHELVLNSAADMIKMVRNHPSLAIWCGGNEITPPEDILIPLRDSLLNKLDGTRCFFEFSNSHEMSYNTIGGNGDGPYGIQKLSYFWQDRTFPFNSEVGSVGVGDYESLQRFIPKDHLKAPVYDPKTGKETVDPVWDYHKYIGYENSIEPYGTPKDVKDFAFKAQLVNYDQYRALMEGYSSHMWDWYTGSIIWKTQNPWTALRGQMYDCYLDPNACLYGLRSGSEPLHAMCNPIDGMLYIVNNGFETRNNLMLIARTYDMDGAGKTVAQFFCNVGSSLAQKVAIIQPQLNQLCDKNGGFLSLELRDQDKHLLGRNFYWYPNSKGEYSGLQQMRKAQVRVEVKKVAEGTIDVKVSNADTNTIAFFSRIALLDAKTDQRILPAFYDDNYISVLPGQTRTVRVNFTHKKGTSYKVTIAGWNVPQQEILVQ